MLEILESMVNSLGGLYFVGNKLMKAILWFIGIFSFHKAAYILIGFFFTRKFKPTENKHKYAILIPARNEEAVIGNILKSIQKQDYPSELLTVFVVADNCTDNTASVARKMGAVCYERFNNEERTKGFALKYLFECIERDYGIENFEGYFVFDSDNLLSKDYVTRMNEAFDEGVKIITSYRNTKNFDENWIASTYALHWLRSIRNNHRARSILRLATNIQGTGFLFANELVKDGWKYTSLTEDRAFTADAVAHGYQISYCDAAMFYDEQPVNLRIAFRQRTRWAKGHLLAFVETGWPLFKNIFIGNSYRDKSKKEKLTKERVIAGIRHRWMAFDTLGQLIPSSLINLFLWLIVTIILYSSYRFGTGIENQALFTGSNFLSKFLKWIFGPVYINAKPGVQAFWFSIALSTFWRILGKLAYDIRNMLNAVYVFIVENKKIKKIPLYKKILYCITWPVFDMFGRYAMYASLFMNVTWKPIPHTSKVTIDDIESKESDNEK